MLLATFVALAVLSAVLAYGGVPTTTPPSRQRWPRDDSFACIENGPCRRQWPGFKQGQGNGFPANSLASGPASPPADPSGPGNGFLGLYADGYQGSSAGLFQSNPTPSGAPPGPTSAGGYGSELEDDPTQQSLGIQSAVTGDESEDEGDSSTSTFPAAAGSSTPALAPAPAGETTSQPGGVLGRHATAASTLFGAIVVSASLALLA